MEIKSKSVFLHKHEQGRWLQKKDTKRFRIKEKCDNIQKIVLQLETNFAWLLFKTHNPIDPSLGGIIGGGRGGGGACVNGTVSASDKFENAEHVLKKKNAFRHKTLQYNSTHSPYSTALGCMRVGKIKGNGTFGLTLNLKKKNQIDE